MAKASKQTITVYVVRQVTWLYNDEWYDPIEGAGVKTFRSREAAQAHADELSKTAPRPDFTSPFELTEDWREITSHSFEELQALMESLDLEAPTDEDDLFSWWYEEMNQGEGLTQEQTDAIWAFFDRVQLYTVVPAELVVE